MGTRAGEGRGVVSVGVDPVGPGSRATAPAPDYCPLMPPRQAADFVVLLTALVQTEIFLAAGGCGKDQKALSGRVEIRGRLSLLLQGKR